MKTLAPKLAALSAAFVVAALMIFAPLLGAGSTSSVAIESVREMARALNTSGNHVYNEMYVNDGTGVVTTPTDGGLIKAVAGAPLTAGETDGSGCITASITTGLFTIADACGAGEVKLTACASNLHAGNTAKTHQGVFAKNGTELDTAPELVKTEAVDAGAQNDAGCITTVQDAAVADTFGFYFKTSGATAEANTLRQGVFRIEKVLNFSN